eukprot:scaffold3808_cov112-Isochrysis_galbana.AAC.46
MRALRSRGSRSHLYAWPGSHIQIHLQPSEAFPTLRAPHRQPPEQQRDPRAPRAAPQVPALPPGHGEPHQQRGAHPQVGSLPHCSQCGAHA